MNTVDQAVVYRGHRITRCDFSRRPYLDGSDRITEGYTFSAAPAATWARTVAECIDLIDLYEDTKGVPVNAWGGFWVEYRERKAARLGQIAYKDYFIRRADTWSPKTLTTCDDYNDRVYFVARLGENALPNRPDGRSAYFQSVDDAVAAIDVFTAGYNLDVETLWLKIDTAIAADALSISLPVRSLNEATVLLLALDRYLARAPKGGHGNALITGSMADIRLRAARELRERLESAIRATQT